MGLLSPRSEPFASVVDVFDMLDCCTQSHWGRAGKKERRWRKTALLYNRGRPAVMSDEGSPENLGQVVEREKRASHNNARCLLTMNIYSCEYCLGDMMLLRGNDGALRRAGMPFIFSTKMAAKKRKTYDHLC